MVFNAIRKLLCSKKSSECRNKKAKRLVARLEVQRLEERAVPAGITLAANAFQVVNTTLNPAVFWQSPSTVNTNIAAAGDRLGASIQASYNSFNALEIGLINGGGWTNPQIIAFMSVGPFRNTVLDTSTARVLIRDPTGTAANPAFTPLVTFRDPGWSTTGGVHA
jgi:hypothetical protein